MPIFRLTQDKISPLPITTFASKGFRERDDVQRLLKENIAVVAPEVLVIAEEFGEWEDSRRRIDLLGIDRDSRLVVIELKRDDQGAHMELQAIRYAAMVSRMTFKRAVQTYAEYATRNGSSVDAHSTIMDWIQPNEPPLDEAVLEVRILLVAADFHKELTTAVLWLREWEIDIRCVRVKPYDDGEGTILEVQPIVPLPEAAEYQISIREEAISRREAARESGESTGYWFMNTGDNGHDPNRSWADCKKYGFMTAGGSKEYQDHARSLKVGDKLFAYLSGFGYVGLGEVIAEAVPMKDFVPQNQAERFLQLPKESDPLGQDNLDTCEYCVSIRWLKAVEPTGAVLKSRFRRPTFQPIKQINLVADLLASFNVKDK